MPLSEHEQRVLDEIESGLYADDPKFASTVRRNSSTPTFGANLWKYLLLGLVGLALLVIGLAYGPKPGGFPVVTLLGFLVMFGAGVGALLRPGARRKSAGTKRGVGNATTGSAKKFGSSQSPKQSGNFSNRMEDRFRRRFEGGQ